MHLFAGLRVRDYAAARPWYERLFGEPSFLPHDTEAVWTPAEDRSVYIVEHPDAGSSVVTIFVDGLDHDPDGNEVAFGGPPLDP